LKKNIFLHSKSKMKPRLPGRIRLVIQSILFVGLAATNAKEGKDDRPNPWWASCHKASAHNIHGKNLSIDNAFENKTIELDDYKGQTLLLLNVASF